MQISKLSWISFLFPGERADSRPQLIQLSTGKCIAQTICVYGNLDASGRIIEFTVHSVATGWTAFGVTTTSSMINASIFMGWGNSSGGYTISDRSSISHIMPLPSRSMSSTIIPLKIPKPEWANSGFSFTRPLVGNEVTINSDSSFIYAFSNMPPLGNVDLPSAKFRIHGFDDCGSLGVVNFLSPPQSPPSTTSTSDSSTSSAAPKPTSTTSSTSVCAPDPDTFCLYGEPDGSGTNMIFTIFAKAAGWAAMGTGDDMSSSSITVAWKNSSGGFTISDRIAKEEAAPTLSKTSSSKIVSLHLTKPDWASLAFSFSKPIRNDDVIFTEQTHYIFAYSKQPLSTIDSPSSSFRQHDKFGVFGAVDFLKKSGGPVTRTTLSPIPSPTPTPEQSGNDSGSTGECIPATFCVYGEPDGKGNVLITIHSSARGWAALGIGSSMSNAAIIVGWKNSRGSYTISDRSSTSNSLPALSSLVSKLVPLKHPAPSWANIAFTISRPFAATFGAVSSGSSYIYAFSNNQPSNIDSTSSSFSKHSSAGSLGVLDFTTAKGTASQPSSIRQNLGIISQNTVLGSKCINSIYCVYSEPDGTGNVFITLHAAARGWAALGTGTSMSESIMIVGWSNSSGGVTISQRFSKDTVMPSLDPSIATLNIQIVSLRVEKPGWANLAFTVKRPLKSDTLTFTPRTNFIYAYSSRIPSSIDSPTSNFAIHDGRGQLGVLDFTSIHKGVGSGSEGGGFGSNDGNSSTTISNNGLIGSTCISNRFCVYSEPDEVGNVFITLQSSLSGWVGLGTGDSMAGSFMIIGWRNSTGGFTVSDRIGTGEVLPNAASTLASVVVPLRIPTPSWAQVSFTILRPLKTSDFTFTSSTRFIYAVSSKAVSASDEINSGLQIHDHYGKLGNLDFTTKHSGIGVTESTGDSPILQLPDGVEYSNVVRIHGYVMIYAWVVCPFVAIFIARYLKSRLGHLWFELHRGIMFLGCFLGTFGGILIIYLFKSGPHFSSVKSLHPLIGLLIGIILVVQFGLGITSDRLFSPDRPSIPWWDKAHWWVGRVVCFMAVLNIFTGIFFAITFDAYALALPVLFGLFMAAGIAAFVYGERWLGQVHHVKLQDPI